MLIAVLVNIDDKISSNHRETNKITIYDRKFERVKFIEDRVIDDFSMKSFIDNLKDCKIIVSKYIEHSSDFFNKLSDLGIRVVKEVRTRDPLYAVRLI